MMKSLNSMMVLQHNVLESVQVFHWLFVQILTYCGHLISPREWTFSQAAHHHYSHSSGRKIFSTDCNLNGSDGNCVNTVSTSGLPSRMQISKQDAVN